jgi:hypothetical protein
VNLATQCIDPRVLIAAIVEIPPTALRPPGAEDRRAHAVAKPCYRTLPRVIFLGRGVNSAGGLRFCRERFASGLLPFADGAQSSDS